MNLLISIPVPIISYLYEASNHQPTEVNRSLLDCSLKRSRNKSTIAFLNDLKVSNSQTVRKKCMCHTEIKICKATIASPQHTFLGSSRHLHLCFMLTTSLWYKDIQHSSDFCFPSLIFLLSFYYITCIIQQRK